MSPWGPWHHVLCTYEYPHDRSCTCVSFWLHAVCSVSGAQDLPNQAWHQTRGPICPSLPLTNFYLTSNLSPLPLHRSDRGQTAAPINPHWWQIASRAVPGLLFPTQNPLRLRWNWPSWKKKDEGHPGANTFYNHRLTNTRAHTHTYRSNHATVHWDFDSISAVT